jgi:hypothetical protein
MELIELTEYDIDAFPETDEPIPDYIEPEPIEPEVKKEKEKEKEPQDEWKQHFLEGEKLFNEMFHNFDKLFENGKLKGFDIIDGFWQYSMNIEHFMDNYGEDIQKELIPWIYKEKENLLNKELWKWFYYQTSITDMYLAYKRLFQYKQYYFKLGLEYHFNEIYKEYCIHFVLVVYGWIENSKNKPYEHLIIPNDNIIPDKYWNKIY